MSGDALRPWRRLAWVSVALILFSAPLYLWRIAYVTAPMSLHEGTLVEATFVGRDKCIDCHKGAYEKWLGSDHDRSMDLATPETVAADWSGRFDHADISASFFEEDGKYKVRTRGLSGEEETLEAAYVFGFEPLQQYLIPFEDGRYQSLSIPWDVNEKQWYYLYPDDAVDPDEWLHWTRPGQNWNAMCSECHSTNVSKGYDPETGGYKTTFSEIDVSCEACHGPGSLHVAWAKIPAMGRPDDMGLVVDTSNLDTHRELAICAYCHSRRAALGDYDHQAGEVLDAMLPQLLNPRLYHPDGQILDEVYVYGSFLQSKMHKMGVRCGDCHDAHSTKTVKQGNELCLQCHRADTYNTPGHHFHKEFHEGKPSDGWLCARCHMPGQYYMGIDYRPDHSIRNPRPDLSEELGTPDACSGCHDDKPLQWSLDAYRKWYGTKRKPHYGEVFAAANRGDPDAGVKLAKLAGDPGYPAIVRATALSRLTNYPGEAMADVAAMALNDEDAHVRWAAVSHLEALPPEERMRLVAPLLQDPVRAVRAQAAVALSSLPMDDWSDRRIGVYASAEAEFVAAMEYALDFASGGFNLGNLHANKGDDDSAEVYYRRAIAVDERFLPARVNLAKLLNRNGKNEAAEAELRRVLELDPDFHDIEYSLALLLVEMNRPGEALDFMSRAAAGLPGRARVHYNHGLLLQSMGLIDEAERALIHAIRIESGNIEFLYGAADHYLRRGRHLEARQLAERIIRLAPELEVGYGILRYLNQNAPDR